MGHYECKKCGYYYDDCECGNEPKISKEEIKEIVVKAKELAKKPWNFKFDQKDKDIFFVNYMIETNREDDEEVKKIQEKAFDDYLKVVKKLSDDELEIIKHAMRVKAIY